MGENVWISVNDRLPEKSGRYYVYPQCKIVQFSVYSNNFISSDYSGAWPIDITHWMPLPEPPDAT